MNKYERTKLKNATKYIMYMTCGIFLRICQHVMQMDL